MALEDSKDSKRENEESLLNPANQSELEKVQLDTLTKLETIGYSLGHFQNDLCAALWFNYLLYFMKNVVFADDKENSGFYAGIVLLSGQIADGLATPLVGIFSDKTNTRIGKRTPWYIFGFVLVTVCFVFIFQECLLCAWFDSDSKALRIFYYTFFPAAFNVGWAAVQVAHMSLVPSLTLSRKTRDKLNNARNTFTYIANLFVLLFAFLVFLILDCDFEQFKVLSLGSLSLGVATSAFFLFTVREAKLVAATKKLQKQLKRKLKFSCDSNLSDDDKDEKPEKKTSPITEEAPISPACDSNGGVTSDLERWELSDDENGQVHMSSKNKKKNAQVTNSNAEEHVTWTYWFRLPSFYLYGCVYMGARLLVNVQSSLIIFYLQNVLGIDKNVDTFDHGLPIEFAIIPMIIYLSSSITSSVLKTVYEKIGRRRAFAIGAVAALIGATAMMFMGPDTKFLMYPLTIIIGVGQSVILNTSISLIAEVVGGKGASGAFVFGAYSLLDKFANGAALYAVMNIEDVSNPHNENYVRICASIIPAAAVVGAWILVLIGKATDYDAGDAVIDDDDKNRPSTTTDKNIN
jgi:Na+/melibiose symporter-like transporter